MSGIIWYVQLVHYPLFARVGEELWFPYHADHERRTGWVVAPLMIVELGTAAGIVVLGGHGVLAVIGLALAAATWVLTFTLAVPLHRQLNQHRDPALIQRLVTINWLRTAVWTAHGLIAAALLAT
jgi:membrane-associated phospholipid phosphatase